MKAKKMAAHADLEVLSSDELRRRLDVLAKVLRRQGEVHDAALIEEAVRRIEEGRRSQLLGRIEFKPLEEN